MCRVMSGTGSLASTSARVTCPTAVERTSPRAISLESSRKMAFSAIRPAGVSFHAVQLSRSPEPTTAHGECPSWGPHSIALHPPIVFAHRLGEDRRAQHCVGPVPGRRGHTSMNPLQLEISPGCRPRCPPVATIARRGQQWPRQVQTGHPLACDCDRRRHRGVRRSLRG